MVPLPPTHDPPSAGSQALVVGLILQVVGIAALLLWLVPKFAEFYNDFSGGEAQLPGITIGLLSVSATLRTQPIVLWSCC